MLLQKVLLMLQFFSAGDSPETLISYNQGYELGGGGSVLDLKREKITSPLPRMLVGQSCTESKLTNACYRMELHTACLFVSSLLLYNLRFLSYAEPRDQKQEITKRCGWSRKNILFLLLKPQHVQISQREKKICSHHCSMTTVLKINGS